MGLWDIKKYFILNKRTSFLLWITFFTIPAISWGQDRDDPLPDNGEYEENWKFENNPWDPRPWPRGPDFRNTPNMAGASFIGQNLQGAQFQGVNLEGANFRNADLRGANFQGANLRGGNLKWARIVDAQFDDALIEEADLSFTLAYSVDFSKSRMAGPQNFYKAYLANASFEGLSIPCSTFEWAQLDIANFLYADVSHSHFGNANLHGTTFAWGKLLGAYFSEARLVHTFFDNSDLQGAQFTDTLLNAISFRSVNLSWACFSGSLLYQCKLENAKLRGANLKATRFTESNLTGANLTDALLINNWWTRAQLEGAFLRRPAPRRPWEFWKPHGAQISPQVLESRGGQDVDTALFQSPSTAEAKKKGWFQRP